MKQQERPEKNMKEEKDEGKASAGIKQYKGTMAVLVTAIAVVMCLYHLLYASGAFMALKIYIVAGPHRALCLAFVTALTFLIYPASKSSPQDKLSWYDIVILVLGLSGSCYLAFFYKIVRYHAAYGFAQPYEIVLAIFTFLAVLEGVRRTVGWGMFYIVAFFLIHPFVCQYFPSIFHGRGYSLGRVVNQLFITNNGVFGVAMGVAASIIIIFIIFGQFLSTSGGGKFFINIAMSLLGHVRGGPAKGAIIASALFGTLSGSSAANVATTGVITIPLMKNIGYRPYFAGAVEAVASNGGQLVPPIMGAVAFLIADFLNMPYIQVCAAALLPSILYFLALFVMVDLEAVKTNLRGLPRSELPSIKKTMKEGWHFLIPLFGLIFLLAVLLYSPEKSCFWALVVLVVISMFDKESRLGPRKIIAAFEQSGRTFCMVGMACAGAGIIIGSMSLTGIGAKLSSAMVSASGGNLGILLILAALACYVLGMGSGAITCYIMLAVLVAPAMIDLGVVPIAAHLFVFYWGLTAYITPPVAIASYVAAGIAGSPPWKTGWASMRLGIICLIIPFMFCYNPALLMQGTLWKIILSTVTSLIGAIGLGIGIQGYFLKRLTWLERILMLAGAFVLIIPGLVTDLIGFGLISIFVLWQLKTSRSTSFNELEDQERRSSLTV